MKILVAAATSAELGPLIDRFSLGHDQPFQRHEHFDLLVTGVGMTATAFALGRFVLPEHTLLLNLGIAGSFDPDFPPGTLVRVCTDTFSELGAEDGEKFLPLDELGFGSASLQPENRRQYPLAEALPAAAGITVNTVHGNEKSIETLLSRYGSGLRLVESMEGAACFHAALQLDIDCLQVRAISNRVERRNRNAWQIGRAIGELNDWAISFLLQPR
ncbi:futalosine hydrolase [Pedobacter yulinensis]|uniref:Futalosine hydrolase n=2 Tax=Pedobacter yulinensis TaxID=2126353 RepID=A0A2T3HPX6_9SPHI|nr:futalosine hydrolase [Pedobacter yulinensis]